tara:strand:+ start:145 stop:771 length:627 start_codon:yes stop_codon:yes gene_type:complete
MSRSKSSKRWLKEHLNDEYVKLSQEKGYRSRASYKLLELQDKDKFIKPGMIAVDLGAAPGGWSQVVAAIVGAKGRVLSTDILPMDNIAGVEFVQGDFTKEDVFNLLLTKLKIDRADLLVSDMAPNMSGIKAIDQPRAMLLSELALELARSVLKKEANILVKVFQGEGSEDFYREMKQTFKVVKTRKPRSSRANSREIYLLGLGYLSGF